MGKKVSFNTNAVLEARLVAGMSQGDRRMEYELYKYCEAYFRANYRGVFFATEDVADEIMQETFITFWENIERRRIYAHRDVVMGKDDEPLRGSIRTYFMGIARLKYLEWAREHPYVADADTEMGKEIRKEGFDMDSMIDGLYGNDEHRMYEIIADVISHMSARCSEILTKFYYEEKDLDSILAEIPSIESKNVLKTKKFKCMEKLRDTANEIYNRYLNDL